MFLLLFFISVKLLCFICTCLKKNTLLYWLSDLWLYVPCVFIFSAFSLFFVLMMKSADATRCEFLFFKASYISRSFYRVCGYWSEPVLYPFDFLFALYPSLSPFFPFSFWFNKGDPTVSFYSIRQPKSCDFQSRNGIFAMRLCTEILLINCYA